MIFRDVYGLGATTRLRVFFRDVGHRYFKAQEHRVKRGDTVK